ncbi:hypothetical protein CVT25_014722, partial [Psilocybe cyanescens]
NWYLGLTHPNIPVAILQVRLYALFSKSHKLLACMIPLYILSTVASLVVMETAFNQAKTDNLISAMAIPGGNFCTILNIPRYIYAFWIPTFAFECFLCLLAVMRGLRHFSFRGRYYSAGVNLVDMLVRDSILYFIAQVFQIIESLRHTLIQMQYWCYLPSLYGGLDKGPGTPIQYVFEKFDVPLGFSVAISSTLCNRMILKVHGIYADNDEEENYGVDRVS